MNAKYDLVNLIFDTYDYSNCFEKEKPNGLREKGDAEKLDDLPLL